MPEASAPSTKYFIAASVACVESRRKATSAFQRQRHQLRPMYRVREVVSGHHHHHAQQHERGVKNSPR